MRNFNSQDLTIMELLVFMLSWHPIKDCWFVNHVRIFQEIKISTVTIKHAILNSGHVLHQHITIGAPNKGQEGVFEFINLQNY